MQTSAGLVLKYVCIVSALFLIATLLIPEAPMRLFTNDAVLMAYFVLNLDELVKLPAVFKHYRKYSWVKNLTETEK